MRARLEELTLKGYKSIRSLENFKFGNLNVLIGPNGAGKSNLISFFRLLAWITPSPGNLQFHVGERGGASKLLFRGPGTSKEIEAQLKMRTPNGENEYSMRLFHAAGDTLIFADEKYRFSHKKYSSPAQWRGEEAGQKESKLSEWASNDKTAQTILIMLQKLNVFQFHNTSSEARIKQRWNKNDNKYLKEDAGNLAPFLLNLKLNRQQHYQRIVQHLRAILPFFADFELDNTQEYILLQWRENHSDVVFDASQSADGMLRTMALITLLLQPEESLPDVVILDEPELGLHPFAIDHVAALIQALSKKVQVILATQSASLLDHFSPEDVIVVDRHGQGSEFKRLSSEELEQWLDEYCLSELWDKNVLGGRPS